VLDNEYVPLNGEPRKKNTGSVKIKVSEARNLNVKTAQYRVIENPKKTGFSLKQSQDFVSIGDHYATTIELPWKSI
jgi:hypothetical protein